MEPDLDTRAAVEISEKDDGRPVCLIITSLDLTNLAECKHGIYQRFRAFVSSVNGQGFRMVVATFGASEEGVGANDDDSKIARQLREHWDVDTDVVVLRRKSLPHLPWIALQVRGLFRYRWIPSVDALISTENASRIANAIGANLSVCVAQGLPSMSVLDSVPELSDVPVVFDLNDVEHIVVERSARYSKGIRQRVMLRCQSPSIKSAERLATRRAASTIVCSLHDSDAICSIGGSRVFVVPNAVDIPEVTPVPRDVHKLLMVGIYLYGPNAEGASWFVREVLPLIRRQVVDVTLDLVGKGAETLPLDVREASGVRCLGFVHDLAQEYRAARLVVCPIRTGSGTRIKILEALAHGRPVVSTHVGAEGLDLTSGEEIILADGSEEFANQCARLLSNDEACGSLSSAGRARVVSHYSRGAQIAAFDKLLREAELLSKSVEIGGRR